MDGGTTRLFKRGRLLKWMQVKTIFTVGLPCLRSKILSLNEWSPGGGGGGVDVDKVKISSGKRQTQQTAS